jgi:hypothetical protein
MGYRKKNLKDHVLVKQLECGVFVTADHGFEHEHDLKSLAFRIVIVHVTREQITFYRPIFPQLLKAAPAIRAYVVT